MRNLFKVSYKFTVQRAGGTEEDGEGQRAVKLLKDAQIGPTLMEKAGVCILMWHKVLLWCKN